MFSRLTKIFRPQRRMTATGTVTEIRKVDVDSAAVPLESAVSLYIDVFSSFETQAVLNVKFIFDVSVVC
jgi:hypothetical protein